MKKVLKKWIKFYRPGTLFSEDWNVEVDEHPALEDIEWPESAYLARMCQREDVVEGDTEFKGKLEYVGKSIFHPNSQVMAFEDVKNDSRATDILVSNMKCNKWSHVVWSRWGNCPQPFDPEKDVVAPQPVEA